MLKRLFLIPLLSAALFARPVTSPRGLVQFDVPENLAQHGPSTWGQYPGTVVEMREEYAPKKDLKNFILSMCPMRQDAKRTKGSAEVDGLDAEVLGHLEGANFSKYLFLRRGNYHYGWSVSAQGHSKAEIEGMFDRLRSSIRLNPDPTLPGEDEAGKVIRDPSGQLELTLPAGFTAVDGRRYRNGNLMLTLTPLGDASADAQRDFAFKYAPTGYKSYLRRNNVEMGQNVGSLIMATSDDGCLESQMVMLSSGKSAVVLTFIAPIKHRGQLSLMRECIAGQARFTTKE